MLKGRITVPISVDTFYPECARTALTHGAKIINDVSGEASDEMAKVVSEFGAGWIIMQKVTCVSSHRVSVLYNCVFMIADLRNAEKAPDRVKILFNSDWKLRPDRNA